jgi:TRAP-type C4-dicarboxylate transport system substrate-binding protein
MILKASVPAALLTLIVLLWPVSAQVTHSATHPIRLRIVGGHASVGQYVQHEEPFWRRHITELTDGQVEADITPFDTSGVPGGSMLNLMRSGVVPFGTAILSLASTGDPELHAIDLPAIAADMPLLRQIVDAFRPRLQEVLLDRHQIELLGVYAYPAQVVFCTQPFASLSNLVGRRVRTSSVGQSELIEALGATPVVIPFVEMVQAIRGGIVDCAVTGAMPGNAAGLHRVTTHVHALPLNWIISVFGANASVWASMPADIQTAVRQGIRGLEQTIWEGAARETADGLACNAGLPVCPTQRRGSMTVVPSTAADDALLNYLLSDIVLPRWIRRCGADCVDAWNNFVAPIKGIRAHASAPLD